MPFPSLNCTARFRWAQTAADSGPCTTVRVFAGARPGNRSPDLGLDLGPSPGLGPTRASPGPDPPRLQSPVAQRSWPQNPSIRVSDAPKRSARMKA